MKTVNECPCARPSEHYPFEGNMTKHKCILKPTLSYVCDEETTRGCHLFKNMQSNWELTKFIQYWINMGERQ